MDRIRCVYAIMCAHACGFAFEELHFMDLMEFSLFSLEMGESATEAKRMN